MDYTKFFKESKGKVIFTGKRLVVKISMRYERYGLLDIGNKVTTIGIFSMTIDDKYEGGLYLGASITMEPTSVNMTSEGTQKFALIELTEGDVFIDNTNVIQDIHLSYNIFNNMVIGGHYPSFLKYEDLGFVFDNIHAITGDKFSVNHAIYELLASALARSPDDYTVYYCNTPMKKDPLIIPLQSAHLAGMSTSSKLIGSHMTKGMDAALATEARSNSELEDIMRKR